MKTMKYGLILLNVLFPLFTWAQGQAHLTFHMGFGANNQFVVGGTIENPGDTPVARGYIVILPVNKRCEPLPFLTQAYGPIPPKGKVEFKIPITETQFEHYRLAGFAAFDDMGFALPAIDETKEIILARQPKEIEECQINRHPPQ